MLRRRTPPQPNQGASVALALLLLPERLGIESTGRTRYAGQNRQEDDSGNDGLHGNISLRKLDAGDPMSSFIDAGNMLPVP